MIGDDGQSLWWLMPDFEDLLGVFSHSADGSHDLVVKVLSEQITERNNI